MNISFMITYLSIAWEVQIFLHFLSYSCHRTRNSICSNLFPKYLAQCVDFHDQTLLLPLPLKHAYYIKTINQKILFYTSHFKLFLFPLLFSLKNLKQTKNMKIFKLGVIFLIMEQFYANWVIFRSCIVEDNPMFYIVWNMKSLINLFLFYFLVFILKY